MTVFNLRARALHQLPLELREPTPFEDALQSENSKPNLVASSESSRYNSNILEHSSRNQITNN